MQHVNNTSFSKNPQHVTSGSLNIVTPNISLTTSNNKQQQQARNDSVLWPNLSQGSRSSSDFVYLFLDRCLSQIHI